MDENKKLKQRHFKNATCIQIGKRLEGYERGSVDVLVQWTQ